jgi:hypothetical protein
VPGDAKRQPINPLGRLGIDFLLGFTVAPAAAFDEFPFDQVRIILWMSTAPWDRSDPRNRAA